MEDLHQQINLKGIDENVEKLFLDLTNIEVIINQIERLPSVVICLSC